VGVGTDATSAFVSLGSSNQSIAVTQDRTTTIHQIDTLIAAQGYTLANVTSINPTVWDNVATVSYSAVGSATTVTQVKNLLQDYGAGSVASTVYTWVDNSGNVNFGVLTVPAQGVTELYYVTIKP
jgi:hypothetical protein